MGLLDRFRGGDDEPADRQASQREEPHPTREVRELVRNGYSQDEITDVLRDEGYTYDQINRALNAAVRESTVRTGNEPRQQGGQGAPPAPPSGGREPPAEQGFEEPGPRQPAAEAPGGDDQYLPRGSDFQEEGGETSQQPTEQAAPASQPVDQGGGYEMGGTAAEQEELIEIVVAEQVADIEDDLDLLFDQLDMLQDRVEEIETGLVGHSESEENAVQELFTRIDRMEDEVSQSQSRIDGMEHALQQVLPNLVENVRDLKRLIEDRNP